MNKPLTVQLVSGPDGEPVTLAEASLHCRVDDTRDNPTLALIIRAATRTAELYLRRPIITQRFREFFSCFPTTGEIVLRKSPLVSVVHLKTYSDVDVATTFSSSNYYVNTVSTPGRLVLRSGATWPTYDRVSNPIEIEYTAGFASAPADVPADIRQAVLMIVAALYEHRGDEIETESQFRIPTLAYELLHPWRDVIL